MGRCLSYELNLLLAELLVQEILKWAHFELRLFLFRFLTRTMLCCQLCYLYGCFVGAERRGLRITARAQSEAYAALHVSRLWIFLVTVPQTISFLPLLFTLRPCAMKVDGLFV